MSAASPETPAPLFAFARSLRDVVRGIAVARTDTARTQRAALLAFAVRVASAAILYLSQIVLARWMGAFEYGVYVSVWTWVLILGLLPTGSCSLPTDTSPMGARCRARSGSRWTCKTPPPSMNTTMA